MQGTSHTTGQGERDAQSERKLLVEVLLAGLKDMQRSQTRIVNRIYRPESGVTRAECRRMVGEFANNIRAQMRHIAEAREAVVEGEAEALSAQDPCDHSQKKHTR